MNTPQNTAESAIRRLTAAVWILVALVAVNVGISLFAAWQTSNVGSQSDPIVGQWLWTKPTNHKHDILPNGTVLCGGEVHGSWRPLDPDKKKYEVFWRDRWTDTLTLSPDGNSLVGTNNDGETIEAKRITFSAPTSQGSDSSRNKPAAASSDTTPEESIVGAAVIAVVEYQKDGERYKAVISEILKKEAGAKFAYKVGDEYPRGSFTPKENVSYGRGGVAFIGKDSPTGYKRMAAIFEDKIPVFDDMSLADFRNLVSKLAAAPAQPSSDSTDQ